MGCRRQPIYFLAAAAGANLNSLAGFRSSSWSKLKSGTLLALPTYRKSVIPAKVYASLDPGVLFPLASPCHEVESLNERRRRAMAPHICCLPALAAIFATVGAMQYSVILGLSPTMSRSSTLVTLNLDTASGALSQRGAFADSTNSIFVVDISSDQKFAHACFARDVIGSVLTSMAISMDKSGLVSGFEVSGNVKSNMPISSMQLVQHLASNSSVVFAVAGNGHDMVGVFHIDIVTGQPSSAEYQSFCGGPSHVLQASLSNESSVLLFPCVDSDEIVVTTTELYGECVGQPLCVVNRVQVETLSGPRRILRHPVALNTMYVVNQYATSVTAWQWDPAGRALTQSAHTPTLPVTAPFQNNCTQKSQYICVWNTFEAVINAAGTVMYVGNRGTASVTYPGVQSNIAAFRLDPKTGAIVGTIGWFDGGGTVSYPNYLSLSPDGAFLLVANERSNSVGVFGVLQDGSLAYRSTYVIGFQQPLFLRILPNLSPSGPTSGAAVAKPFSAALLIAVLTILLYLAHF